MLSARRELYLHTGLLNESVANNMVVGDSTNAILVGAPGSGLTNMARHFVSQLCTEYEEDSLTIDIIDCNNEDFAILKGVEAYRRCIGSIVCSTNINVLVDALKSVEVKLNYVLEKLASKGFNSFNELVEKCDINTYAVPTRRIVFINGFKRLFEPDSGRYPEVCRIMRSIRMLGRTAGVHVVMSSTHIGKDVPADIIDMFGLRFVLRCDNASEEALLGSTSVLEISKTYGEIAVKCDNISFVDVATKCTGRDFLYAVAL